MAGQPAWSGLLVTMAISLATAAWGGPPSPRMEAEASTSAVFDGLENAGVVSGHLPVPMLLVFNTHGKLTLRIQGGPPPDVSAQVSVALHGSKPIHPEFSLDQLESMFFPHTKSRANGTAIVYITMDESICPPCEGLVAEYQNALEAPLTEAGASIYMVTVRPDR